MPKSRSRSRSRSKIVFHSRYRSRSRYGVKRSRGCRGGATLKDLRKSAKACGVRNYSKLKKCTLVRKISEAGCGGITYLHRKSAKAYKKRGSRSRSRGRRLGHEWRGKHIILNN